MEPVRLVKYRLIRYKDQFTCVVQDSGLVIGTCCIAYSLLANHLDSYSFYITVSIGKLLRLIDDPGDCSKE